MCASLHLREEVMNWINPALHGVAQPARPESAPVDADGQTQAGFALRVVDIADMVVSDDPNDVLVTYSLGSCLGVAIYDPVARAGGMIHCMLPLSKVDEEKARAKPAMFVDTGMTVLMEALFRLGARKANAVVKIAGASQVLERQGLFRIGERNVAVARKILWKNSMLIAAEDVGGDVARTVRLEIGTGRFFIRSEGVMREM